MLHIGLRREAGTQGCSRFGLLARFDSSKLLVGFVYGGTILVEIEIEIHFQLEMPLGPCFLPWW
jgi:hypothetical protein